MLDRYDILIHPLETVPGVPDKNYVRMATLPAIQDVIDSMHIENMDP
jgi:hypothetical protein